MTKPDEVVAALPPIEAPYPPVKVTDATCPACQEHSLVIEWRLTAKPVGSFSLSGLQMKFSATHQPWIRCTSCGIEAKGKEEIRGSA